MDPIRDRIGRVGLLGAPGGCIARGFGALFRTTAGVIHAVCVHVDVEGLLRLLGVRLNVCAFWQNQVLGLSGIVALAACYAFQLSFAAHLVEGGFDARWVWGCLGSSLQPQSHLTRWEWGSSVSSYLVLSGSSARFAVVLRPNPLPNPSPGGRGAQARRRTAHGGSGAQECRHTSCSGAVGRGWWRCFGRTLSPTPLPVGEGLKGETVGEGLKSVVMPRIARRIGITRS
jgi:hypothetical protein